MWSSGLERMGALGITGQSHWRLQKVIFEVVKWLRENGCPLDEYAIIWAAGNGHLEVVKWLRVKEAPWDKWAIGYAIQGGHVEVVNWLRENGCPE